MTANLVTSNNLDTKREDFRRYLDENGVTDKLTVALMKLYQEETKPTDPIAYIRKQLGGDIEVDNEKVKELQAKIDELMKENKEVKIDAEINRTQVKKTESEIERILDKKYEAFKADAAGTSLLKSYLTEEVFDDLKESTTEFNGTLLDNIQSGLSHFDSEVGIFASDKNAYETFAQLFTPVLEDLHDISADINQPELDFGDSINDLDDLDPEGNFIKTIRVVINRALDKFEFAPLLSVEKLEEIENEVQKILMKIENEDFKGTYKTLTEISDEDQKQWIEEQILFSEPNNKFLKAAETYRGWPKGRGLFKNEKCNFLVWINEQEHLKFLSVNDGANLREVYERMVKGIEFFKELEFAHHDRWGFLAHNLKNIGNAMEITVKVKIPKLSLEENAAKLETLLNEQKITGKDLGKGFYELTNRKKLGINEFDTAKAFQKSIKEIVTAEKCLHLE